MALTPVARRSVADQRYEQLLDLILSGEQPAGSTLPPERELAVRFGVSRTVKEPNSGREKRPLSTISALIAATISPASRPAALAGMSAARAMTSVRNFFDMLGPRLPLGWQDG